MPTISFAKGDRVRVVRRIKDDGTIGLEGTVRDGPDKFGRYGLHLDKKPRKHPHWFSWFPPEHLELVSTPLHGTGQKGQGTDDAG